MPYGVETVVANKFRSSPPEKTRAKTHHPKRSLFMIGRRQVLRSGPGGFNLEVPRDHNHEPRWLDILLQCRLNLLRRQRLDLLLQFGFEVHGSARVSEVREEARQG